MVGQEPGAQGNHQPGSALAWKVSITHSASGASCQGPDVKEEKQEVKMGAAGVKL